MSKVEAREEALQSLYAADSLETDLDVSGLSRRASDLAVGVRQHLSTIDAALADVSRGWRIERMPTVDRNVLRLGAYELLYTDAPVGVILDQAVEMAKQYSTARSGAFVNGVLSKLAERRPSTTST